MHHFFKIIDAPVEHGAFAKHAAKCHQTQEEQVAVGLYKKRPALSIALLCFFIFEKKQNSNYSNNGST